MKQPKYIRTNEWNTLLPQEIHCIVESIYVEQNKSDRKEQKSDYCTHILQWNRERENKGISSDKYFVLEENWWIEIGGVERIKIRQRWHSDSGGG